MAADVCITAECPVECPQRTNERNKLQNKAQNVQILESNCAAAAMADSAALCFYSAACVTYFPGEQSFLRVT